MNREIQGFLQQRGIYNKKETTILVTDSGLGGISVAAELYAKLQEQSIYEKVRIIFFNALFDADSGYSKLPIREEKVDIFNTALHGMIPYNPDVIMMACNTLSVLYPYTIFSATTTIPVIGIVEIGVDHILRMVAGDQDATVILFATPTTIDEGTHKHLLAQQFSASNIIEQACPDLAVAIGDGYPDWARELIHQYVQQAVHNILERSSHIYASLNCTHFGYYRDEFLRAFQENGIHNIRILNPNSEMIKLFLPEDGQPVASAAEISIEFVSKVKFPPKGMESLSPLLEVYSKEVMSAFHNYHHDVNLF